MALALNNLQKVDMPLSKETKPNHCRLFNAKSSLYIHLNIFGWVGFYGTSTIIGYLMPNLLHTYILNI